MPGTDRIIHTPAGGVGYPGSVCFRRHAGGDDDVVSLGNPSLKLLGFDVHRVQATYAGTYKKSIHFTIFTNNIWS